MHEMITREAAIDGGLFQYYTGKLCKHGHISARKVSNGVCMECAALLTKRWRSEGKKQEMYEAKILPTSEYLHECFEIVDENLFWKVRPSCHFKTQKGHRISVAISSGKLAGHRNRRHKYLEVRLDGKLYKGHRIIYKMLTGKDPINMIDHIDGDVTNDNILNLRESTAQENARNASKRAKNGSSEYKGVFLDKQSIWCSVVTVDDTTSIKQHNSEYDAAKDYDKRAKELFGEFAKLNFDTETLDKLLIEY